MKSYTLTLSRWHKVAERLHGEALKLEERATQILTNTSITARNRLGVADQLYLLSAEAKEASERLAGLWTAIGTIRKALASENARVGVSSRLTEVDLLNRKIRFLTNVLTRQQADMVSPDRLEAVRDSDSGMGSATHTIRIRFLEVDAKRTLELDLAQATKVRNAILDHISDLNREKLALELPDESADVAGLTESV